MKCASCGRDNPAGARFCADCGTEQVSTPIAVAAAANAARSRGAMPQAANAPQAQGARAANAPQAQSAQAAQVANAAKAQSAQAANAPQAQSAQAANAPRAESSRATPRPARSERPPVVREHAAPWGADTQPPAFPAGSDPFDITGDTYVATPAPRAQPATPAAIPVYASHPRRLGIAALLVTLCVVVALVGFVVWKMRAGAPAEPIINGDSDSSVMSTFPPDATPQRPARSGAALPAESTQSAAGTTTDSTGAAAAAPPVRTPVEIKPLPAKPARKPVVAAAPKPSPQPAPVVVPEAHPAPAPPPVAAAPRKAPPADRWAQMNEELSRCTREDFIARVICDQRVRFRYCDGYWGKTAQCPGNPVPDRGQ